MNNVIKLDRGTVRNFNCEGLLMQDVLQRIPITHRQLNYWTTSGRITCHFHVKDKVFVFGGSGRTACWPLDQVKILARAAKLVELGFTVDHSFQIATDFDELRRVMREMSSIELSYIFQDLAYEARRAAYEEEDGWGSVVIGDVALIESED